MGGYVKQGPKTAFLRSVGLSPANFHLQLLQHAMVCDVT